MGLMKARPRGTAAGGPDQAQPGYEGVMFGLHVHCHGYCCAH
jgi:hypothetical protein